jgi:hypothetical protein
MYKPLFAMVLVSSTALAWDQDTLIEFNADGSVRYDARIAMHRPCEARWNVQTCKNVKVLENLVKSTPEYQEGYYGKLEEVKQRRENAKVAALVAYQQWQDDLREREVRAAEQNAFANTMNALKQSPSVSVNVSQTVFH